MFLPSGNIRVFVLLICTMCLNACANNYAQLDMAEHKEIIAADKSHIEEISQSPAKVSLSLSEAMERAIHYNLDARVSAIEVLAKEDNITLEQLKALPNVAVSAAYQGRSNLGAASSQSVLSGNQSLEPSISTEPHRRTADLSLNWNMIDVVLAAMQANSAKDQAVIARERHAKVLQNIQRDVYAAYWRAYAAQKTSQDAGQLTDDAQEQLANLDLAFKEKLLSKPQAAERRQALEEQLIRLQRTRESLAFAEIELKSLLSYAPETKLTLTSKPRTYLDKARALLNKDIEALEIEALEKRPEMRETIAQRNIALRDTRMEIAKTFPGMKFFYALNYDSNDFLVDNRWANFSATLIQSLTNLVTAPTRYKSAKNRELLEDNRRVSLAAAIITQLHLSRARLEYLLDLYQSDASATNTANTIATATKTKQQEGFASGIDVTTARIEALNARMNEMLSAAEAHDAAATFLNSLGIEMMEGMS